MRVIIMMISAYVYSYMVVHNVIIIMSGRTCVDLVIKRTLELLFCYYNCHAIIVSIA